MIELKELQEFSKSFSALIVDDEEEFLSAFWDISRHVFKNSFFAKNGEEALMTWYQHKDSIDIIITDINMPKKNGISLIEDIRKESNSIPILVISAHSEVKYFKELINLGVDGFILKPITQGQLFKILYKICKNLFDEIAIKNYQDELEHSVNSVIEQNRYFIKLTRLFKEFANGVPTEQKKSIIETIKEKGERDLDTILEYICPMFNQYTLDKEIEKSIKQSNKISAKEYLAMIDFDKYFIETFEDILVLSEYAQDVYELLDDELDIETFSKISELFEKYSSLILMFSEFDELSNSIHSISRFFSENSFENLNKNLDLKELAKLVKYYMVDLENWKNSIFVKKSCNDIHYFDKQAESFANSIWELLDEKDGDEEEIILF